MTGILPLFQSLRSAFNTIFVWLNLVLTSFRTGALHSLLVPFCIVIAIPLILVAIRLIRSVVWGD